MRSKTAWSGALSPADSPRMCASSVARAIRCRPEAVWPRALGLAKSIARLWRRGRAVPAATSAQTMSELLQARLLS